MTLRTERLRTMEQARASVEGLDYQPGDRAGAYAFGRRTLVRLTPSRRPWAEALPVGGAGASRA